VASFEEKLTEWQQRRRAMERETRLLVIDDDAGARKQLDDLLFRAHLSARSVSTAELALELMAVQEYPLVLSSESLQGLGGLYLVRQLRTLHPESDALLHAAEPSAELYAKALELRVLDLIEHPFPPTDQFANRVRAAIRRNVNRRIRSHVLKELRTRLSVLAPELRVRTTSLLEKRLSAFKSLLGSFNRVLVVEVESAAAADGRDLRGLSEHLLLAGLHVETVGSLEEALARAAAGDIHLLVIDASLDEDGLGELVSGLRRSSPLLEVMLVSTYPDRARLEPALRLGIAGFLAWPPPSPSVIALRVNEILRRARRERLMDNLLAELFRETNSALGDPAPDRSWAAFCELVALDRVPQLGPERASGTSRPDAVEAVEYLDEVLDTLLAPEEDVLIIEEVELQNLPEETGGGSERRVHARVPESQFVRFRARTSPAATLALIGDLSEGGLFIRSGELLLPGTFVDVDFNIQHAEQAYLIRCRAQVAWVARDNRQSPLGPGFGVKFLEPPAEVVRLLQTIVLTRVQGS
jgi:DNA-binding response OmpR family regulator